MTLQIADRVWDTTVTAGTGTISLAGLPPNAYQTFGSVCSTNDTIYYALAGRTANVWEVGLGTYNSVGPTLARTTVFASSAGGARVVLAGTTDVLGVFPASKINSITGDASLTAAGVFALLNIPNNTTMAGDILATAITVPVTPSAGTAAIFVDSTKKNLSVINDAGIVSGTVVPSAAAAHQFATMVSGAGVITWTQPAFSDISGNIGTGQMNFGTSASSATFWRGDGTWATPVAGAGGSNTQVQFNSGGGLSGDSGFTYAGNGQVTLNFGSQFTDNNAHALTINGTWNSAAIATTATSGDGTTATITTASTFYPVGTTVNVTGVTPTGYNGQYVVTANNGVNTTSFLNSTTGAQSVAGTIQQQFDAPLIVNPTFSAGAPFSACFDAQVSGVSKFSVNQFGATVQGGVQLGGTAALNVFADITTNTSDFNETLVLLNTGALGSVMRLGFTDFTDGGASVCQIDGASVSGGGSMRFRTRAPSHGIYNEWIRLDSGGILSYWGKRFRNYNTTDSVSNPTNYERGVFDWDSNNILTIGTEAGGTGTVRNLRFTLGGNIWLDYGINHSGIWNFQANAATAVASLQNNSSSGYSAFDVYDSTATQRAGFGYANGSAGNATLAGNGYFWTNGGIDFIMSVSNTPIFAFRMFHAGIADLSAQTTASTFRVYNTTSDQTTSSPTNYERGVLDWTTTANRFTIGTQANGTGSTREVAFVGSGKFTFVSPSSSVTPTNNGDLCIQATSNTQLTFKYKGGDGTIRSNTLTLS